MIRILIIFLIIFLNSSSNSFAYFDPGTGAFIIQAILGFIAAVVASVTMTWNKIKMFFEKIYKKKKIKIDEKKK